MSIESALASTAPKADKIVDHLVSELATLAVGRPTPSLVDTVEVEQYQTRVPLKSVAQVSVGDGQSLVITPWDKQTLPLIEKAIQSANLGFSPVNDGVNIRIILPPPSEERRKQLLKVVATRSEESKVSLRNVRQDVMQELKKLKGQVSDDELKRAEEQLQKVVTEYSSKVDQITANKEKEITQI